MTITDLRISVTTDVDAALTALESLTATIETLKANAEQGIGFERFSQELKQFMSDIASVDTTAFTSKMQEIRTSVEGFVSTMNTAFKIDPTALSSVQNILEQIDGLTNTISEKTGRVNINYKETIPAAREVSSEAEKTSTHFKSATTATSGLAKGIQMIKRMFVSRLIRMAIMEVFKQIKEGMDLLAQYSPEVKKTLSGFSTDFKYLANSFVSAIYPVLSGVLPLVNAVVNAFASVLDVVAQFFTYLGGDTSYFKATKGFVEYSTEADKAKAKTDKLKASILGFDELNVLKGNNGTASDTASLSPSSFYEETPIDEKLIPAFEKIKEFLKKVKSFLEPMWDALKWAYDKISDFVNNSGIGEFISKHSEEIMDVLAALAAAVVSAKLLGFIASLGTIGKLIAGGAAIVIGAKLSFDTGYKIGQGTATFKDWIMGALGLFIGGIGGKILLGAFGVGGGAAFAIGVSVALALGIAGVIKGKIDDMKAKAEAREIIQELQSEIEESNELNLRIRTNIDLRSEELGDLIGTYGVAKELIDKIYALVNDPSADIPTIQAYVDTLNGLGFGTLIESFDPLTGAISETKSEVEALLEDMIKLSFAEFGKEKLAPTMIDLSEEEKNLQKLTKKRDEAYKQVVSDARALYRKVTGNDAGISDSNVLNTVQGYRNYQVWFNGASQEVENLKSAYTAYDEISREVETTTRNIKDLQAETAKYTSFVTGEFVLGFDEAGHAIYRTFEDIKSDGIGSFAAIKDESGRTIGSINTGFYDLSNYINELNPYLTIESTDIGDEVSVSLAGVQELLNNHPELQIDVVYNLPAQPIDLGWTNFTLGTGNTAKSTNGKDFWVVPQYATGGFPEDGLFMANHGEVVGQFANGRTAVANNDQIIQGISQGVYDAFTRANGDGGDIVINNYNDGQLTSTKIISASDRANRRAGKTVLTVGR